MGDNVIQIDFKAINEREDFEAKTTKCIHDLVDIFYEYFSPPVAATLAAAVSQTLVNVGEAVAAEIEAQQETEDS
jgi:hypothetical protein